MRLIPRAHEFGWVHDKCRYPSPGCKRVKDGRCTTYLRPDYWWSDGRTCPLASHVEHETAKVEQGKKRIGQQKQKRR